MSSKEQRESFWNYLTTEKGMRPPGVTLKRLEAIKESVLADDYFWFQVIERFGAEGNAVASRFYDAHPKFNTESSRANFWGMIRERL